MYYLKKKLNHFNILLILNYSFNIFLILFYCFSIENINKYFFYHKNIIRNLISKYFIKKKFNLFDNFI